MALRDAGLVPTLVEAGWDVDDWGDLPGFRWMPDSNNPRAQNLKPTLSMIQKVEAATRRAVGSGAFALVLGGNCTIELGVIAGLSAPNTRVGLLYIDMHPDLNTPDSVIDGALDWMGVAHLLGLEGSVEALATFAQRSPLVEPADVAYFGIDPDKCTRAETERLDALSILVVPLQTVARDASSAALELIDRWGAKYDRLAVHLDVDVLDFVDLPVSEEATRNSGLTFVQLIESLAVFLQSPNVKSLTVTELNPDHADLEGSSLRRFVAGIGSAIQVR